MGLYAQQQMTERRERDRETDTVISAMAESANSMYALL
jgi:hypothetical protein